MMCWSYPLYRGKHVLILFYGLNVGCGDEFLHIGLWSGRINEKRVGTTPTLFALVSISYLLPSAIWRLGFCPYRLGRFAFAVSLGLRGLGRCGTALLGRRGDVGLVLGAAIGSRDGLGGLLGGAGAHTAHETLNLSSGVYYALLAGVEGVAVAAQVGLYGVAR